MILKSKRILHKMAEFSCLYDFDDDLLDDFAKKRDICENCT
jgi:hypothetical protein